MDKRSKPKGEKPRSEPEIIPPERTRGQSAQGKPRMLIFVDTHDTEHVYVARLRPLGIIIAVLTTGILFAAMLILLLSAFLVWIPVVVLFAAAAIIARLLRRYFERAP